MSEEKIIYVDVDFVTLDLETEWLNRYNRDWDDNLTQDKVTRWAIDDFVKPECGTNIFKYLQQPDIYDEVRLTAGAAEGIAELRKMGFRCVFASAGVHVGKLRRLQTLGLIGHSEKDFIAISDKSLLRGRYLIDDGFHNIEAFRGGVGILFDAPHNRQYEYARRAMDWEHVIKIIKQSEAVIEAFENFI